MTNRSHACGTNEEIILICHGRGSNITWIATTDSIDIGRIIFFNSDPEGTIINQGTIRGLLIDTDVSNNLVSELHVFTTPSMRPISITCSSESGRSSHLIAPPGTYTSDYNYIDTIGTILIAWFNDCILGKSGQIANLIIMIVNPVPYYSIRACLCLWIY